MSIFPTKILLATDGSEEAEMAATTAINLPKNTDSELYILKIIRSSLVPVLVIPCGADVRLQDASSAARGFEREQ